MRDYLDFSNKVVLVTGSTRNIGKATAELFAERGATVIINSRHQEDIDRAVEEMRLKGYRVLGVRADVGIAEEVLAMMEKINAAFGRLDVAVNNAADRPFDHLTEDDDEKSLEGAWRTNVAGALNVSRAAAKMMIKNKRGGSLVNISSAAAIRGSSVAGLDYIATKGALLSLTRGLASKFRRFGIRVNAVVPSMISTDRRENVAQEILEQAARMSFAGRIGSPEEVASVCLFLGSDMASYVNGEIIVLGGVLKEGVADKM